MPVSLIVVDDFLENALELRELALGLDYPVPPPAETYYPGRNSANRVVIDEVDQAVAKILGERIKPSLGNAHGRFRIAMAGDQGRGGVHVDKCDWSGVLYMSRPEDCRGGTSFFRHKATGTERAPITQDELAAAGLRSNEELWDKLIRPDTNRPDRWEAVMTVPMRFNRLILFKPWLWHNAGVSFGDTVQNCRLVYLLFYSFDR